MDMIGKALKTAISSPQVLSALADGLSHPATVQTGESRYDRLIDATNRLPRPALAFGAIAIFVFAMLDPAGFARRMAALEAAPDELWWLMGAVIATHFGAREAYHQRHRMAAQTPVMPEAIPPETSA